MKKVIALLALFSVAVFAQNTFTDQRDGKKYKTVKIGTQTWMAENLNYKAKDSKCYEICEYGVGRLYDWETAMTVCPDGWHLPSDKEWQTLVDFAGGEKVAGNKLKKKTSGIGNHVGTDEYGFSAQLGGKGSSILEILKGKYIASGFWWSATEYEHFNGSQAYIRNIYSQASDVFRYNYEKFDLLSVRCIQGSQPNNASPSVAPKESAKTESSDENLSFADPRDGKKYRYVKIGNQTWMAQNLDYQGSKDEPLGSCYGDVHSINIRKCQRYGRLYNWEEAVKACPEGWHLPDNNEWVTLVNFVGGDKIVGKKLKAKNEWAWFRNEKTRKSKKGDGTDEYGFSALPGGKARNTTYYSDIGEMGYWWSATEYDNHSAPVFILEHMSDEAGGSFKKRSELKEDKHSVRCLKE